MSAVEAGMRRYLLARGWVPGFNGLWRQPGPVHRWLTLTAAVTVELARDRRGDRRLAA